MLFKLTAIVCYYMSYDTQLPCRLIAKSWSLWNQLTQSKLHI